VLNKKTKHKLFSKDKISFDLLCIYAFVVPLGTLFRFTSEEGSLGISTILLLSLVTIYISSTVPLLFKKKIFFILLLLVLWFSLSTLFALDSIISGYKTMAMIIMYIFFAITITKMNLPANRLKSFFLWLVAGMFLSSGLTLIDFLGIIDVPCANELQRSTDIGDDKIFQASGFFPRRSAMAAYFSLVLPVLIPLFINFSNAMLKIIIAFTYFISMLILLFTHNLSGIIAILISSGVYFLWGDRINFVKRMKRIVYASLIILSFFYLVSVYFPDAKNVYFVRLNVPSSLASISAENVARQKESDNMRLYFFKHSLASLTKNPIGHGYTQIWTEKYGLKDPHNIITQVIWGAGVFSFIWLGLFGYVLINLFTTKSCRHNGFFFYYDALRFGLFSWFIVGMAHTIICTGLAWIFFGMLINIRTQIHCYKKEKKEKKKMVMVF